MCIMSFKTYVDSVVLHVDPITGAWVVLIAGPLILIGLLCLPCDRDR